MRRTVCTLVGILAALVPVGAGAATPASAEPGDRNLIEFLATDSGFDRNAQDLDVFDRYLRVLLRRDPDAYLGELLADGERRRTAFLPTDLAFARMVTARDGQRPGSERATWEAVRGRGLFNVQRVLIYHVVLDRTINRNDLLAARGTRIEVATAGHVTVYVRNGRVVLGDDDRESPNAVVTTSNLNRGNKQVGHAIDRVMHP